MIDAFAKNVNLSELEKYHCMVWGYTAGHSQLYVRLYVPPFDPDKHLYLGFHSVKYFSGHMKWPGANFRYGTREETMKLLQSELITISENELENYLTAYRLFLVEKPNFLIGILAWGDVAVITTPISSNISSESNE